MPQLSKKNVKPVKKLNNTFKSPLLTKENIEKILHESDEGNVSTSFTRKKSIQNKTPSETKGDISISGSDFSSRLNEPVIKKAYLEFCKNQNDDNKSFDITDLSPIDNERAVTSTQIDTLTDSGVISLSQDILNKENVKAAYMNVSFDEILDDFALEKDIKNANNILNNDLKVKKDIASSKQKKVKKPSNIPKRKLNKHVTKSTKIVKHIKQNEKENKNRKDRAIKEILPVPKISKNDKIDIERMYQIQECRNVGLYVLCDKCDKARYLSDVKDPLDLPEKWFCNMNPDENYNKCEDPEDDKKDEEFLIDNKFNAGSIVWAKMDGYPWWPAMVDDDPDLENYFWLEENIIAPTQYHVMFFDSSKVTRAWIYAASLKPFKMNMHNPQYLPSKFSKYNQRISCAMEQAKDAIDLPLIKRLRKYSFITRYVQCLKKGKYNDPENKKTNPSIYKTEGEEANGNKKKFRRIHYSLMSDESNFSCISKELDNYENVELDLFF